MSKNTFSKVRISRRFNAGVLKMARCSNNNFRRKLFESLFICKGRKYTHMILKTNSIISGIFVGGVDHQHQRRDAIWPQMHILLIRIHIYDSNPAHGCLILTTKTCQSFSGQIFRFCPRVLVKYKTPETLQNLSHGIGLLLGGPKCNVFWSISIFFLGQKVCDCSVELDNSSM